MIMGRHKQMPGKSYMVINQTDQEAQVEFTYLCPYCMKDTNVQITVNVAGFDALESGGFYKPLACEHCKKTTDARFWRSNRV